MSTTSKCQCGHRIMLIDGVWQHVWWKRDRASGRYVRHGCPSCVWMGDPPAGVVLALPAEVGSPV